MARSHSRVEKIQYSEVLACGIVCCQFIRQEMQVVLPQYLLLDRPFRDETIDETLLRLTLAANPPDRLGLEPTCFLR